MLALAGCLLLPVPPASASPPDLEVTGNRIRNVATGNEFIPRGVNWPSFEYACVQGWGYSHSGASPETAQAMLAWNINTVRIPLNQDCWLGDDDQPENGLLPPYLTSSGYRDAVEAFVDDLTDAGLAVILDLHWTGQDGTVADGLRPMADERSDDFWASVADRFKTNDAVIFDLFNEPHSRWDPAAHDWAFLHTWACWWQGGCAAPDQADTDYPITGAEYTTVGMGSLLAAVRSTGATQPVILSGLDYANDLSEWSERAPADDQLIAGFHNYPGQKCSNAACWAGKVETVAAGHPVITAEFGQRNCQSDFLDRYMNWADLRGIGYLAWAWWVLPVEGCANYALITDLEGTPTPGYGAQFRAHLEDPATPPDDQEPEIIPELPAPAERANPGLKIVSAKVRKNRLKARLRVRAVATEPVRVRVEFFRNGLKRKRRFEVKVREGSATIKRRLPRKAKPRRLIASYPGDKLLLPGVRRASLRKKKNR